MQSSIKCVCEHQTKNIGQWESKGTTEIQTDINQPISVSSIEKLDEYILQNGQLKPIVNNDLSVINVIDNDGIPSSPIKYGIQWSLPTYDDNQDDINKSQISIIKSHEYDQGDSRSLSDQARSVKILIEKFENQSKLKPYQQEKNNRTDSDLTSIDSQTTKIDLNQNEQNLSYNTSFSNFDATIPSNLSSSIELERFECVSTTSNISEFLRNH